MFISREIQNSIFLHLPINTAPGLQAMAIDFVVLHPLHFTNRRSPGILTPSDNIMPLNECRPMVLEALKRYVHGDSEIFTYENTVRVIHCIIEWLDNCIIIEAQFMHHNHTLVDQISFIKEQMNKIMNTLPLVSLPRSEYLLDVLMQQESHRRFKNKKAEKIQQIWKECVTNPSHPICQRRLLYEWSTFEKSAQN